MPKGQNELFVLIQVVLFFSQRTLILVTELKSSYFIRRLGRANVGKPCFRAARYAITQVRSQRRTA